MDNKKNSNLNLMSENESINEISTSLEETSELENVYDLPYNSKFVKKPVKSVYK